MTFFYEMIGRLVVTLVWRKFGSQIQVAFGVALIAAIAGGAAAAYRLVTRDVEEG